MLEGLKMACAGGVRQAEELQDREAEKDGEQVIFWHVQVPLQ
jgi:hypothetical protein